MSFRTWLTMAILPAALAVRGTAVYAQDAPPMKVQRLVLKNGLTVLALEDHTVPATAYYTVFKVGSRNERLGITGLSHLFEHMMFNGSAKFKPKVFDQLIEAGGGYSNAFTSTDTTEYQEDFSSSTLDTVLALESDRMRALKLDRQNLEQERGIVKEERRVSIDNSPSASMSELLFNCAFVAHPYHWDVIGFMKDIDAIRLQDARDYFRIHYAPNNAVVCIVGDFDTGKLFASIHKDYDDIPRQPPSPPVVNDEPPQSGERRISYNRAAELPAVIIGYHCGSYKSPESPALDLLSTILTGGESSRLYRTLVYEKQIATEVGSNNDARIDPGLFTFYAQAAPGHTSAECEAGIYAALDEIVKNGVTERELQKAKNGARVHFLSSFTTNMGRAGVIAEYEANWGSWEQLYKVLPRYDRVTVADVRGAAGRIFSERKRTVVVLFPDAEAQPNANASQGGTR